MSIPELTEEYLKQLAERMTPAARDDNFSTANQREALIQFYSPAQGKSTAAMVDAIGECARKRGLATSWPEGVRVFFADDMQVMVWIPVTKFDKTDQEQYPISWYEGNRRFRVNLRDSLAPRALEVPQGMVMETQASILDLPDYGTVLYFNLSEKTMRAIRKEESAEEAAE